MFVVLVLTVTSCEDVLEEMPHDIVEENFYQTADDIKSAVNAVYLPFRGGTFTGNYAVIVDTHTDWGYGRGSRAVLNDWNGLNTSWANGVGAMWNGFYLGIRNANIVIANAPANLDDGQEAVDQYVAEARFLRAYFYLQLVRNWGGVPLRTELNMEEQNLPRNSIDQVYDLILEDLLAAESGLPEDQSEIGRPTSFAAKTMLADVYLDLAMYDDARSKAMEVIQSNKYSLVPVTTRDDFWNIFGPDVITSLEEIWYIKYSHLEGQGNFMGWIVNHASTNLYNFGGAFAHYSVATDPFYQNWPDDDLRKSLWDIADFGLGDSTIVTRKFPDPNAVTRNDISTDFPIYRYAEVLYIFAEADTRVKGAPTPEALDAVNQVHRRALGLDPTQPASTDFVAGDYNLESFIDLIIEERGYEFIFEAKRWFTLKRTGKAAEILKENRGVDIPEKHYLWPLPNSELNFNEAINDDDQNPGY